MGMSGVRDEFGDRMKAYEAAETRRVFDPNLPLYARLDGRSFRQFTRGMERPFDVRMRHVMVDTTMRLVQEANACIGYTQSDEISLVWDAVVPPAERLFGGKVFKLTSVLASYATSAFIHSLGDWFEGAELNELVQLFPHFDARVFSVPSRVEAANAILWRTVDARKNSVSSAARVVFSSRQLHGKDQRAMIEMLASRGVDYEAAYPEWFKWGTFVRRVKFKAEIGGEPCTRSGIFEVPMPEFRKVTNRVGVIFHGEEPETFNPNWATPPGDHLKEYMEVHQMDVPTLAEKTGVSSDILAAILAGTGAVTGEIAATFETVFGLKSDIWLGLQSHWDSRLSKE